MSSEIAKFHVRQKVWHVVDTDGLPGVITGIVFRDDCVTYEVTWSIHHIDDHWAHELSDTRVFPGIIGDDGDDGDKRPRKPVRV